MRRILVTGGAGYIGSHVVMMLADQGYDTLTVDNLSNGNRWAVLAGAFEKADIGDTDAMERIIKRFRPDAVMHFAAWIVVPESVREPLRYYQNNTCNVINLVKACLRSDVQRFIFSSTAAVYGIPCAGTVDEASPLNPINPYGHSKAMTEQVLKDASTANHGFRCVSLRYFNASGADEQGRIGQAYKESTHLITRALKAAKQEIPMLEIYGTDYPTPDGTCVRDYIHVDDLATGHIAALDYLMGGGKSDVFNCGYGHGSSVREVVEMVKKVTGRTFPVVESGRREGDPPALVANSDKMRRVLGWRPKHDNLEYIIRTAWAWEQKRK